MHEGVFLPSIKRVEGYQTACFLAQGLATAATARARPRGWGRMDSVAATLAFNLLTAVLFFHSLDHVLSFYRDR